MCNLVFTFGIAINENVKANFILVCYIYVAYYKDSGCISLLLVLLHACNSNEWRFYFYELTNVSKPVMGGVLSIVIGKTSFIFYFS